MSAPLTIQHLLTHPKVGTTITLSAWVRTKRSAKNVTFLALSDGSTLATLQVVIPEGALPDALLHQCTTGACVQVTGQVADSQGSGQTIELQAERLLVLGPASADDYPLQPKRHTLEFLRTLPHLRLRTNTFGAVFRIRHALNFAVHQFFHTHGFFHLPTPFLTSSDAEGAGELFRVTTLPPNNPPLTTAKEVDFSKDFFGQQAFLTVSGQLEAEVGALALGKVYTFGPTFRAENSNTTRHLAEFWMVEPEMAFYDLAANIGLAKTFIQEVIQYALKHCADDLQFLADRQAQAQRQLPAAQRDLPLLEKLEQLTTATFTQLTYTEALDILQRSKPNQKKQFAYPVDTWGDELHSEHERFLVERHCKGPVIITDYPKDSKAFYMRQNEDGKTVAAMDMLLPGLGEVIGGAQREERLPQLEAALQANGIAPEHLDWYLDTRRFGSTPHSGFGLGFERLVQFVTGMENIRDVTLFPRTPGHIQG